ncbi:MAG: SusC/RagA family TonB-linked outer membrane protein, partial [Sphingobacteriaceae bacterium]
MKTILTTCLLLWLGLTLARAQQLIGKVSDVGGAPVAGAALQFDNGIYHGLTNIKGQFKVLLPKGNYQLKLSCVGYKTLSLRVNVPQLDSLKLTMQPEIQHLEEVTVSTGYQTLPKERATGSFTKVNERLFNEQVGVNVLDRLAYITNGLSVDTKTNAGGIMVHGLSTINGPRTPLIVVDNFPYEGALENLNPNEVESVTVLKDAAAASIWGARAGNGVIVITTKRAKFQAPLNVAFNS